jgi:hypothetical protein
MANHRDQWRVLVSTIINLQVPRNAENFLISWATVSFSIRILLHGVISLATFRGFLFNVNHTVLHTRAVSKVCGLTLLLRVGNLWRCGDGLFFEIPPLARDALLTTLHPFLENVLQTVDQFEISCLGAPFSWLEKPRNRMGWDLDCMVDVLMGFHTSTSSKPNREFNSDW